jgi:hypothetical protein
MMFALIVPALCGAFYVGAASRPGAHKVVLATIYFVPAGLVLLVAAVKMVIISKRAMSYRLGLDAELAAGQELDQLMRHGAFVFHDYPAEKFNIDHVVICESGVFAVETKARMKPDRG